MSRTDAAPDVMAQQLIVAVQALRSIRDNVSAQTDWRDIETMAGDAIDAVFVLGAMPEDEPEPAEPKRYALVEQMGHRSTIASIRETTFAGKPMIEMTAVKTGAVHLVAPESLYEITWITEADALARSQGIHWTAVALPAAGDRDDDDPEVRENGGVWGFTEADL